MIAESKGTIESFTRWMDRNPCPVAGSGVHRWLMSAARVAQKMGVDDSACGLVEARMSRPPNSRGEIADTFRKVGLSAGSFVGALPTKLPRAWAQSTADHYAEKGRKTGVVDRSDLWRLSPVPVHQELTEAVIDTLFSPDELICCTRGFAGAVTAPRKEFTGKLAEFSHLVPSPMCKPWGLNQEGERSVRCLDNTGPRRFQVVEFDKAPSLHIQAQMLWGLSEHMPLVLVLFSGKKSLHGWFHAEPRGEAAAQKFHRLAVACRADAQMGVRCQIARMPDVVREDTGAVQGVQYWNPTALKGGVN